MPLSFQLLLRLDPDAATVLSQQTTRETFLMQLSPRTLLILIDRQRLSQLRFSLKSRSKILLRLGQDGLFGIQSIQVSLPAGAILGQHLREQIGRIARLGLWLDACKLRVDPAQPKAGELQLS